MIPSADQKTNNFSTYNCIEKKRETRHIWETHLEKNAPAMAKALADSLIQEVLKDVVAKFEDPYADSFSFKRNYYFDLDYAEVITAIKTRAKESARLKPFDEWFPKLENRSDHDIDFTYFQEQFDPIGERISELVQLQLSDFSKGAGYPPLKDKVSWQSSYEERGFQMEKHYLSISLWIDTQKELGTLKRVSSEEKENS